MPETADSKKTNLAILCLSLGALVVLVLFTDFLGLRIHFFKNHLLHWRRNNNPLILLAALSLFNLFRQWKFVSKYVNAVSGLSLFIYLIHENNLIRSYFRPWIWSVIKTHYGYDRIIVWVFVFSAALFAASAAVSVLYSKTIHNAVCRAADTAYNAVRKCFYAVSTGVMKIK